MVIPESSTEYLHVTVASTPPVDLPPPRFAFLPHSTRTNPSLGNWHDGEWDGQTARILIGPEGGIVLASGVWKVWIRLDPPNNELVIRNTGALVIT